MLEELGISFGTAVVVLTALYFVVKWGVRNGIREAVQEIEEKRAEETAGREREKGGASEYSDRHNKFFVRRIRL